MASLLTHRKEETKQEKKLSREKLKSDDKYLLNAENIIDSMRTR